MSTQPMSEHASTPASSARPSGNVTFLFTDIVGSTRLWETHPTCMAASFQQHEDLIRATAELAGGYIYKMVGDAFQIAFAQPSAALTAAVMIQRGLAAVEWGRTGPLSVRIGLHMGYTEERANDYVGPLLNRLARLVAAASGGQILLSAAVATRIDPSLEAPVRLRDLGRYYLKDLRDPEQIFQAVAPDLPAAFPALNPRVALPAQAPATPPAPPASARRRQPAQPCRSRPATAPALHASAPLSAHMAGPDTESGTVAPWLQSRFPWPRQR